MGMGSHRLSGRVVLMDTPLRHDTVACSCHMRFFQPNVIVIMPIVVAFSQGLGPLLS